MVTMMLYLILLLPALLGLIFLFFEIKILISEDSQAVNRIPGPKGVPFLGHSLDLIVHPAALFKAARQWSKDYYPIYKLWSTNMYSVVNFMAPEDFQTILSNPVHNEKSIIYSFLHDWLGEGLLTSHSDKWQQRRKILTPTFHFNILKRFIRVFNRHAKECVDDFKNDSANEVDILQYISKSALNTITETAMGYNLMNFQDEKKYRHSVYKIGHMLIYRIARPWLIYKVLNYLTIEFYKERFLLRYLKGFTKTVIKERELAFHESEVTNAFEDPNDDDVYVGKKRKQLAMLDLLFSAKNKGQINDEGILEEVDTFMFEGHDTVSMSLQYTFMLLANHSDVQQKLYEEVTTILTDNREPTYEDLNAMTYMEMVLKESLRLYPSVPVISRLCGEDFTAASGHRVPAGTVLVLNIYDTHHNETIFPEPEKFIPERFNVENSKNRHPYAYLAFSAGSRNCIGKKYAMLNMKCKMAAIVKYFVLLPVTKPEDITHVSDIVLRTKDPIKVQFRVRK